MAWIDSSSVKEKKKLEFKVGGRAVINSDSLLYPRPKGSIVKVIMVYEHHIKITPTLMHNGLIHRRHLTPLETPKRYLNNLYDKY